MSDRSFRNPVMCSFNRGDVHNALFRNDNTCRSITTDFDIFAAIYNSVPLLVCCINMWQHVCVCWVPPLPQLIFIPIVLQTFICLKLKVLPFRFSVLLLTF